jgi:hypothetical protein
LALLVLVLAQSLADRGQRMSLSVASVIALVWARAALTVMIAAQKSWKKGWVAS